MRFTIVYLVITILIYASFTNAQHYHEASMPNFKSNADAQKRLKTWLKAVTNNRSETHDPYLILTNEELSAINGKNNPNVTHSNPMTDLIASESYLSQDKGSDNTLLNKQSEVSGSPPISTNVQLINNANFDYASIFKTLYPIEELHSPIDMAQIFGTDSNNKDLSYTSGQTPQVLHKYTEVNLDNIPISGFSNSTKQSIPTEQEKHSKSEVPHENLLIPYQQPSSQSDHNPDSKQEVVSEPKHENNYANYKLGINHNGKDYKFEVTADEKKVKVFRLIPQATVEEVPMPSTIDYTRSPEHDFISKVEEVPLPPPNIARGDDLYENEYELPPHNPQLQPQSVHFPKPPKNNYEQTVHFPKPPENNYENSHNNDQQPLSYLPPKLTREQITLVVPKQVALYPQQSPHYEHRINLPKIELIDLGQQQHYPNNQPVKYPAHNKPDYYLQNVKEISLEIPVKQHTYSPPKQVTYNENNDNKPYTNDYDGKEEVQEKVIELFSDFSMANNGDTKVSNIDIKIHGDNHKPENYAPQPNSKYNYAPPNHPKHTIENSYDPSSHNTKTGEYDELSVHKSIHSASEPKYNQKFNYPHPTHAHPSQPYHHNTKPTYFPNKPHITSVSPYQHYQQPPPPPPPPKYDYVPVHYSTRYEPPPYTDHSHNSQTNTRYSRSSGVHRKHKDNNYGTPKRNAHYQQKAHRQTAYDREEKPCPYNNPEKFIPQLRPLSGDAFPPYLDENYRPHSNNYQVAKEYPTNFGTDPDDPLKEFWRYFTGLTCDEKKIQIINFMCKNGDCKNHLFKTDNRQYTQKYRKDPNEWQSVFDLYDNPGSSSELNFKAFVPQSLQSQRRQFKTPSNINNNANVSRNVWVGVGTRDQYNSYAFPCKGKRDAYYPDVNNNCEVYYKCVNQKVEQKLKCPFGMRFNQSIQRCERGLQTRCANQ